MCKLNIETRFFSKLYHFFLQKTTFFSKPNSALFDRSHCSRRQSDTMCLWRRDWMFAPTIRYQFKRHLFNRRPCTGPHLWAGPEGDCNCWDTGIEISFNFSRSRQFAFVRNACGHWGDLWRGLTLPAYKTPFNALGNGGAGWVDPCVEKSVYCNAHYV